LKILNLFSILENPRVVNFGSLKVQADIGSSAVNRHICYRWGVLY